MKKKLAILLMLGILILQAACQTTAATPQYTVDDFKNVKLTQSDLPAGFDIYGEEDAAQLGMDISTFSALLKDFTTAEPASTIVAADMNVDTFQIFFGVVTAPITAAEGANFDQALNDPEATRKGFEQGLGGTATLLEGGEKVGDKSLGFSFNLASNTFTLKGEMVVSRRGEALQLAILISLASAEPTASVLDLAQKIDVQLVKIQNK
jgi:hypothetical protein